MTGMTISNAIREGNPSQRALGSCGLTCLLACLLYGPLILTLRTASYPKKPMPTLFLYGILFLYQLLLVLVLYGGLYLVRGVGQNFIVANWTKSRNWLEDFFTGLLVGIFSIGLTVAIHFLFGSFSRSGTNPSNLQPRNPLEIVLFLPLMIVVAATEELIFRGYFFQQFYAWSGNIGRAMILQAAAFSTAHGLHQTAAGVTDKIAFGLLLGWLANREKSLIPGIIAHSFGNIIFALLGIVLVN
jgi:membrane protease YdiL (CAAX protease family)